MESDQLLEPCRNGRFLAAAQRELLLEPHIRALAISVDYAGTSVRLSGLVPSFYAKQLAQEVIIRLLRQMKSDQTVENAIEVQ